MHKYQHLFPNLVHLQYSKSMGVSDTFSQLHVLVI